RAPTDRYRMVTRLHDVHRVDLALDQYRCARPFAINNVNPVNQFTHRYSAPLIPEYIRICPSIFYVSQPPVRQTPRYCHGSTPLIVADPHFALNSFGYAAPT